MQALAKQYNKANERKLRLKKAQQNTAPVHVTTLSQRKRKEEEKRVEAELQKLIRQINKSASYVQSQSQLKGLPEPVENAFIQ